MNISEGERVSAVLEEIGYRRTDNEQIAEILGIVACSVRQKAIDRVYSKIAQWNKWKAHRSLLTFATGCILPFDKQQFLKKFDLIFNIQELAELPKMIREYGVPLPHTYTIPTIARKQDAAGQSGVDHLNVSPNYGSPFEAYLPIQNGCDKFCTFCAVPYTRGRETSRPSDEIYREVEKLLAADYKTITLLGQNVNSYGLDAPGAECEFPELLRTVAELVRASQKQCWIYFTSPHPRDFSDALLRVMAEYPQIAKQVHLPLQSGDDKLLIRMNRNYNMMRYRHLVENIRSMLPTATLFTDIIVGFCGESEQQFEMTRMAMREFRYNMAYIAAYSPRPGAASSRWTDNVPHDEKKRRLAELSIELQRTAFAHNSALIGRRIPVLVTGKDRKEGYLAGRTEGKINVRFQSADTGRIGTITHIEVNAAHGLSIEGHCAPADETLQQEVVTRQLA